MAARSVLRVLAMRGSIYLLPRERAADGLALAASRPLLATLRQAGVSEDLYHQFRERREHVLSGQQLTGAEMRRA